MERNKDNSSKVRMLIFCIIGIILLVLVLFLLLHFTPFTKNNKVTSHTVSAKSVVIPTEEPLVTPTIVSSAKSDLKTFIFPDSSTRYSFDYPSSWSVVEIGHNNIVRLNFEGHCKVEVSTNGEPESTGDQTKEVKTYAGRTFYLTTQKKDNIPYSETFSLSEATSKDGFSMVKVTLPSSNTSECQQLVDQILSSLKFGQ